MLYHFLLIFPLDLKEFLTSYLSSISPRFYPTGLFWRINTTYWSQDGFDQRGSVTTTKELLSSGNAPMTGTAPAPIPRSRSNRRRHGRLPACIFPWRPYGFIIHHRSMKDLSCSFAIHSVPFTFQLSHKVPCCYYSCRLAHTSEYRIRWQGRCMALEILFPLHHRDVVSCVWQLPTGVVVVMTHDRRRLVKHVSW